MPPRPSSLPSQRWGKIDIGIDRPIVPSQLTSRDDAFGDRLGAKNRSPHAEIMRDGTVPVAREKLWLWITRNHDQECYFAARARGGRGRRGRTYSVGRRDRYRARRLRWAALRCPNPADGRWF